ncbi:MAG TPA: histidine kinase dimerization/phosphoacceptor domain -containing protein, partial [Candidatus Obscuribacterales bacterium]
FEHPDYGKVLVAVQQDISDRKEAQEKIQASLKEKELLLKEIYHRVKNNLQVIYSLLNLQSRTLSDPALKAVIKDSQSRVRAMALVHEKLYQSPDLTRINLADYVKSLVRSLLETYCLNANQIATHVEIATCGLDIETALPCGLILTELISNSLKYAFPNERPGRIVITSTPAADQHIRLTIKDDGIGLPTHVNWQVVSSLGLSLVRNLAQQINAEVGIIPTATGTEFQLLLPLQEPS